MKAVQDKLIVRDMVPYETPTDSLIELPESASSGLVKGYLVAVGPDVREPAFESCLKDGFPVVFGKYMGQTIESGGVDYRVVKEADVLGYLMEP